LLKPEKNTDKDKFILSNKGRLNKELLLEPILDFNGPTFFLCAFMQDASELLKEQGVSADRIKQESFGGKDWLTVPDPSGDTSVPFVEFFALGIAVLN
jgi:ferredoxin-NADP reductase